MQQAIAANPWDAFASTYPRQLWLERRAIRRLLSLLDLKPGDALLDAGTGTGALLAEVADLPSPPTHVTGLDSSPEMIAQAPSLPDGWRLEQGDVIRMPFDDASFDVVTASYLLHILDAAARRDAIAEMARVLRPQGRVGTITIAPPRRAVSRALTAPLRWATGRSAGRLAGLHPLDPAIELARAGLTVTAKARSFAGYPSLCMVATKPMGVRSA